MPGGGQRQLHSWIGYVIWTVSQSCYPLSCVIHANRERGIEAVNRSEEQAIVQVAPSAVQQLWFQLGWRIVISVAILWLIVRMH